MKTLLAALIVQFAELRPQIRVDGDSQAAAFAVVLQQAHDAAAEPEPVDPVQQQLDRLTESVTEINASVTEIRELMHLEVTSEAEVKDLSVNRLDSAFGTKF